MAVNLNRATRVNCKSRPAEPLLYGSCLLCDEAAGPGGLCRPCRNDMPWIINSCRYCGVVLENSDVCGMCLTSPLPPWLFLRAAFVYNYPVNRLILRMKYHGDIHAAHVLAAQSAQILKVAAQRHDLPDVIVPVPMHRLRMASRGYNQALLIAQTMGKCLHMEVDTSLCRRVRYTPAQAGLDAGSRARNLKDAFESCGDRCRGKSIAVVDDVITTTATVREVSRALIRAGADSLQVWAVARQQLHNPP